MKILWVKISWLKEQLTGVKQVENKNITPNENCANWEFSVECPIIKELVKNRTNLILNNKTLWQH